MTVVELKVMENSVCFYLEVVEPFHRSVSPHQSFVNQQHAPSYKNTLYTSPEVLIYFLV